MKNTILVIAILGLFVSCKNETKAPSSSSTAQEEQTKPGQPGTKADPNTTLHEIGLFRLSLPNGYEQMNTLAQIQTTLEAEAPEILKVDSGLIDVFDLNLRMKRNYLFDTKSNEHLNYIYFDEAGPRFSLNGPNVEVFISSFEKKSKAQYASRNYTIERLDDKIMKVWENYILKFSHKHTLDNTEWFTTQYLIFFKEGRNSIHLIDYNYNGGEPDLEKYITTIY